MTLKSWWQKRREEIVKKDVDTFFEKKLQGYIQSQTEYRKVLTRMYFPRVGQDLLEQKADFLTEYSIREQEVKRNSDSWFRDTYGCHCSNNKVEIARLSGQKKWRKMMSQFRIQQNKAKTR